jgi:hypothetical protein
MAIGDERMAELARQYPGASQKEQWSLPLMLGWTYGAWAAICVPLMALTVGLVPLVVVLMVHSHPVMKAWQARRKQFVKDERNARKQGKLGG